MEAPKKGLRVDRKTMCTGLPYHIMVDKSLTIIQLGSYLSKTLKLDLIFRAKLGECFEIFLDNSVVKVENFDDLSGLIGKKVVLKIIPRKQDNRKHVSIRGQFCVVRDVSMIMFLGSPCVSSLGEMREFGLCLSDIPIYDATRDLVLFDKATETQDRMKRRMENLQVQIEAASAEADEERKKNVNLLEMLFPPDIAQRLWQGETIQTERKDNVTLLFSDLVGFTAICSTATPSQVVTMLATLYSEFDELCGFLDIYKMETIGDAYCCACGLHKARETHAVRVAWMGLEMLRCAHNAIDHRGEKIRMRVGIHSGSVLTGVVGRTMPKYCLFGSDVTIANQMESTGEPGRLHASPSALRCLREYSGFRIEHRDITTLPKALQDQKEPGGFVNGFSKSTDLDQTENCQEQIIDNHEEIVKAVKSENPEQTEQNKNNSTDPKIPNGSH